MDNASTLQSLLDRRGRVVFPSGVFVIERPLVIHSDTSLFLAPDTVLRLPDDGVFSLIENDGLREDKENFNISIEGGVWDGTNEKCERKFLAPGESYAEGGKFDRERYLKNDYLGLLMRFVHCANLHLSSLTVKDPLSFGVQIADAKNFTVENVYLDYNCKKRNMDGIHVTGPARFGLIRNIRGTANDDQVALTADATALTEITRGPIEDIVIDGVFGENTYTGVRLLSSGNPVRNVTVRNLFGTCRYNAVSFTHHDQHPGAPCLIENVHISDVYMSKPASFDFDDGKFHFDTEDGAALHCPLIEFFPGTVSKNVRIENVFRRETRNEVDAPLIRISSAAVVEGLSLGTLVQSFPDGREVPPVRDRREGKRY
ncbi:MAG: hypothetical protein IJV00_07810 [Clostridia bacterium]|nr:hypothetical protein [Clostridia bacterium]